MIRFSFASIFVCLALASETAQATWQRIDLPNVFMRPCEGKDCNVTSKKQTGVYSTQIPAAPTKWFPPEEDCPKTNSLGKSIYRRTSTRWRSDFLPKALGVSFKGLISSKAKGSSKNEFSVFFHEDKCYNGSGEYGWVFREDDKQGRFYLCGNCNNKDKPPFKRPQQTWATWPGNLKCISGECERVAKALKNPATYRYWNAIQLADGNFNLQLVDPTSWKKLEVTLKKPENFPNWSGKGGYVTIVAHKGAEVKSPTASYMHIDEVKIWH